jgi:hypothetical protein
VVVSGAEEVVVAMVVVEVGPRVVEVEGNAAWVVVVPTVSPPHEATMRAMTTTPVPRLIDTPGG